MTRITLYKNTSDSVVPMLDNTAYRMHRFRTSASPIKGLTSDILVRLYTVLVKKKFCDTVV